MSDATLRQPVLSDSELHSAAIDNGHRLGFLIAKSPVLSDQEKEALLNLLPEMTADQLDQLATVLEAQLANSLSADVDKVAVEKLQTAEDEYDEKIANAQDQALNQLYRLSKEIPD